MEDSAARSTGATEYMAYASEVRRSTIRTMHPNCPMASFVVRVLGRNADGSVVCLDVTTRRELVLPPGELRPANKYEAVAGRAADLMEAMPEHKFAHRPEPLAVGRWTVDEICRRTGLSRYMVNGVINKAAIKTTLRTEGMVFRPCRLIHYTDANRIIEACLPPAGWCTRRQALEMTGLSKLHLDKVSVRTMTAPAIPGATKTTWYSIPDLRGVRRNCAVYGGVAPTGRPASRDTPVKVNVAVPRGSTAAEHIELIRKAVGERRNAKVKITYTNDQ